MKPLPARSSRHGRRSSALLIVLGSLVFISALIISFVASVTTERQSAHIYANNSSVRLLASSCVDLVMGQIKDATHGVDASGNPLAWASQPGMVRTYNIAGQPSAYYKLYSWTGMIGSGAFDPSAAAETPPADWTNSPAVYTDLNDPVSGIYPIVDPSATNSVQGFSISGAPVSSRDAAPMPVQWLYVLQDGTLVPASGTGKSITVAGATAGNPIVGRVAFWTDDDTCKININTAAGDVWFDSANPPATGSAGNPGSFWDTPRTASASETNLALNQPAHNEFQRYPGHPATTYLTTVFTNLTRAQLYAIVPRVNDGGSKGGSVSVTSASPVVQKTDRLYSSVDEMLVGATNRAVNAPLNAAAVRSASFFLTAHSRAPEVNLFNQPRIAVWPVNASNSPSYRTPFDSLVAFCGTLNSNGYYFQRADSVTQTNDLPAAASATGVGRNRALLTYLHNLTGQPVPGFSTGGETFASKYPQDRDQILTEIFDYVRALNEVDVTTAAMTHSFTPSTNSGVNAPNGPPQSAQITPIYDSVTKTRGLGRFPTITEVAILFAGIGQTTTAATNSPPLIASYPAGESMLPWIPLSQNNGTTNAPVGTTRVQAILLMNLNVPAAGYSSVLHSFYIGATGLDAFTWGDGVAFTHAMGFTANPVQRVFGSYSQFGGNEGVYNAANPDDIRDPIGNGMNCNLYYQDGVFQGRQGFVGFPFYSGTIDLPTTGGQIQCSGGSVTISIYQGTNAYPLLATWPTGSPVLQKINVTFPSFTCPVPGLAPRILYTSTGSNTFDYRNFGSRLARYDTVSNRGWITTQDVVRSMVLDSTVADPRTVAGLTNVPSSYFIPGPNYNDASKAIGHGLVDESIFPLYGATLGKLVPGVTYTTNATYTGVNGFPSNVALLTGTTNLQPTSVQSGWSTYNGASIPQAYVPGGSGAVGANGVFAGGGTSTVPGDWDTGIGTQTDGAYINKADEGDTLASGGFNTPYFSAAQIGSYLVSSNFFSPNRQMPSPAMFGSLPTGVISAKPWQTLLFRPDPGGHPGGKTPPDHLLLDLFDMPVLEPYAISDPFSTAGKINMNYQIVPFTYLTRTTGVQAVLKSEKILAIPTSDGPKYKTSAAPDRRYFLDIAETLKGFAQRFAANDIFRCASEICSIWLVPAGKALAYADMQAFWSSTTGVNNGALTGDNVRERPYANIYPRLTTKSNTFTVHYRVQTLKHVPPTPAHLAQNWVEGGDVVTGEYRGSSTLERYLDTSDPTLPDYATAASPPPIDNFYKFRVLETKEFRP